MSPESQPTPPAYSPFPLLLLAADVGLVETTVETRLGSCVIRHRASPTSATATLFLHGAAGAWTTWTPLLQAATSARTPIENPVLLDLPGWGDSSMPGGGLTVETISAFIRESVESVGYTDWRIVGHSLGGSIALHLAATSPECTRSIAVVSPTTFSIIRSIDHPVRNFGEMPAFTMLLGVMRLLTALGCAGVGLVRTAAATGAAKLAFAPLFRHGFRVPPSLITATVRDLRPAAFAAAADATRGYDAVAVWSDIRCPVVALRGDRDIFVGPRDFDDLAQVLPAARLAVVAGCGHFAIAERPVEVLAAIFAGWADEPKP